MTAGKFIGKIKTLCHDNGRLFGFIIPNSLIGNHTGDVSFESLDLRDISLGATLI
jgi:hypothetical protein